MDLFLTLLYYIGFKYVQIVEEIANDILQRCPKPIDIEKVSAKYPVLYEESMNTVLQQEIIR